MYKIAVINDLSGFGRCSLTAAISVIASMGVQPCPLPTAVLSAQTCYPSYFCYSLTDKMDAFRKEWKKMNVSFDGIYTGFMSETRQIDIVSDFLDDFHNKNTFLLVDPVMGDAGKAYDTFSDEFGEKMKKLVKRADIITPNLTEFCILTGEKYEKISALDDKKQISDMLCNMAGPLMEHGPGQVIVTGVRFKDPDNAVEQIGNFLITREGLYCAAFPFIGKGYSGTGDLFASVITGAKARHDRTEDAMELAGAFLELAITDSVKEQIPENDGVNYEPYLWMLSDKRRISHEKNTMVCG